MTEVEWFRFFRITTTSHIMRIAILLFGLFGLAGCAVHGEPEASNQDEPIILSEGTRTYRFAAKITDNGGITPFVVGKEITGHFTYDLKGTKKPADPRTNPELAAMGAQYISERNGFVFRTGDFKFSAVGEVRLSVGKSEKNKRVGTISSEGVGMGASDLRLPKGWSMDHDTRSKTFYIGFSNIPARGAIKSTEIPDRIPFAELKDEREMRLYFCSIKWPGGEVAEEAVVKAAVASLDEVVADKK